MNWLNAKFSSYTLCTVFVMLICFNALAQDGYKISVQKGHSYPKIQGVLYHPAGKYVISWSIDNTVKIWEINTGIIIRTILIDKGVILKISLHADGNQIQVELANQAILIYDFNTGGLLLNSENPGFKYLKFRLEPSTNTITYTLTEYELLILDYVLGKKEKVILSEPAAYAVYIKKDLLFIENKVNRRLLNTATKKILWSEEDTSAVLHTVYQANSPFLFLIKKRGISAISLTEYKTLQISGQKIPDFYPTNLRSKGNSYLLYNQSQWVILDYSNFSLFGGLQSGFSIDQSYLQFMNPSNQNNNENLPYKLSNNSNFVARVQHGAQGPELSVSKFNTSDDWFIQSEGGINNFDFSPDNKSIAVASGAGDILLHSLITRKELKRLGTTANTFITKTGISPDSKIIAVVCKSPERNGKQSNFSISVFNWKECRQIFYRDNLYTFEDQFEFQFSPDSKFILIPTIKNDYNTIYCELFNLETGLVEKVFHFQWYGRLEYSISKDSRFIVDRMLNRIIDLNKGRSAIDLPDKSPQTHDHFVELSADGTKAAAYQYTAFNPVISVWEIDSLRLKFKLTGDVLKNHHSLREMKISPDNDYAIFVSDDQISKLNLTNRQIIHLNGKFGNGQIVFNPEGTQFMLVKDTQILLFDKSFQKVKAKLNLNKNEDYYFYSAQFKGSNQLLIQKKGQKNVRYGFFYPVINQYSEYTVENGRFSMVGNSSESIADISFCNEIKITNSFSGIGIIDTQNRKIVDLLLSENDTWTFVLPNNFYSNFKSTVSPGLIWVDGLKYIFFDQLDIRYNRPDKILEAVQNPDISLINSYRKAWEKRIRKLNVDTSSFRTGFNVPVCNFFEREKITFDQKKEFLDLRIKAFDSLHFIDRLNIWVNEVPLFGLSGIHLKNYTRIDTIIRIQLSAGLNKIEASVRNKTGIESYRFPLMVNYQPVQPALEKIYFIGIGIDQFANQNYNLSYSSKDIRDLAFKLKEKFKENIIIDTLYNQSVTIKNIKELKSKLLRTSVNDKVFISYSGHGLLNKDFDYFLSTFSINFDQPEKDGLPYEELENLLDGIPARKKILLIDACHSGEVDKEEMFRISSATDTLKKMGIKGGKPTYTGKTTLGMKNSFELMQSLFVNVGRSTGATVIAAAAGTQFAREEGKLQNGVFTYSLLEAIEKYPQMQVSQLKTIISQRVVQLTNGLQQPTSRSENKAVDWRLW
jgi:WD40 repeat protein